MSANVEKMFSVKVQAWHGLATVLESHPTSAEAIKAAGLDWDPELRPLYFQDKDGNMQPVTERVVAIRSDNNKFLSVVSTDYKPLKNTEAFEFFDPLVKDGTAVYETAGSLFDGRQVWIQARLTEPITVGKDEHRPHVLLTNGHDGKRGITVSPTLTRVVCWNTMRMALSEGHINWFQHRGDLVAKMEQAKRTLGLIKNSLDDQKQALEHMLNRRVDDAEIDTLLDAILQIDVVEPVIPDESDAVGESTFIPSAMKYRMGMKNKILELHEAGTGASGDTRGTAYGVYNAITEFVDYYGGTRSKDRVNYVMFGAGAQLRNRAAEVLLNV